MTKTYKIVDANVTKNKVLLKKKNIEYYIDGILEAVEFYSADGKKTDHEIRPGFTEEKGK